MKLLGFGLLLIVITVIEFQADLLDPLYHSILGLLGFLLLFSCFKGHKHLVIIVMSSGELVFVVGFSSHKYLEFSKMLIKLSRVPINSLFTTNIKSESRYQNPVYQPIEKNYDPIEKRTMWEQEDDVEEFNDVTYQLKRNKVTNKDWKQRICPICSEKLVPIKDENSWHCFNCQKYYDD